MKGSFDDILPESISPESEAILLDHLKRKLKVAASVMVDLFHAFEEHYGDEARDILHELAARTYPQRPNVGEPKQDLHAFCDGLDSACAGTHQWERVTEEPDRIAYRYTRCMWAEVFRELGEPELGYLWCASDEPAAQAYNPRLGFERTKLLMHGDGECDHIFYVAEAD